MPPPNCMKPVIAEAAQDIEDALSLDDESEEAFEPVDADDLEVLRGVALRTVVARHALALDDLARISRGADRTRAAHVHATVGVHTAREAVALDAAGEAAALAGADDVDGLPGLEDLVDL